MRKNLHYLFLLSSLIFLGSCHWSNKNSKKIDVSGIEYQLNLQRFDKDFFTADTTQLYASLNEVRKQDSLFFDFYTMNIMRFGFISDSISPTMLDLNHFFTNPYVLGLKDTVDARFGTCEDLEQELELALKHFKYYFPEKEVPQFKTMISEFGYNVVALDSAYVAISLDMYLGKNYPYYGSFDFPYYVIERFEPEFIVPNAMEVLYNSYFAPDELAETDALIHAMIEKGKALYFMECMQPEKEKHFLVYYTPEQLAWCENSEGEIWKFYNEYDLFYSRNYMEHTRHLGPGPSTPGMPQEAPGNVGSWVGWQIVNQYMENAGEELSLAKLLATSPADILAKSQYKPK